MRSAKRSFVGAACATAAVARSARRPTWQNLEHKFIAFLNVPSCNVFTSIFRRLATLSSGSNGLVQLLRPLTIPRFNGWTHAVATPAVSVFAMHSALRQRESVHRGFM